MTPHQIQACCELSDFLTSCNPHAVHCHLQAQLRVAVETVRAESRNRGPSGQGRAMYLSALLKRKDGASSSELANKASSLVGLWGQRKLCSRRPDAMVEEELVQRSWGRRNLGARGREKKAVWLAEQLGMRSQRAVPLNGSQEQTRHWEPQGCYIRYKVYKTMSLKTPDSR